MKKVPLKKIVVLVTFGMILFMSKGMAQVEKGVTSTGKEVDCTTINPSVDKTVNEYGAIVTHPRVTRNGKIITEECPTCGVDLSITDTVNCVSITLNATITDGDPTSAILKVYSDAAHSTQVGSDISAIISDDKISAVAANLNCHTRYYFLLETTEGTETCTFDWTDSTRDMSFENLTTCTVGSVRALGIGSDLSHEHLAEGTTDQIDSVYDHEGNAYAVVQIGNQCWLKQNMRAKTSPRQGTGEGQVNLQFATTPTLDNYNPYYYNYSTVTQFTLRERGLLYNWTAAMDTFYTSANDPEEVDFPNRRGICPAGWHLPTDGEWFAMEKNVLNDFDYTDASNSGLSSRGTGVGKLASSCYWYNMGSTTTPNSYYYVDRNSTGFSLLPTGYYFGAFYNAKNATYFWVATSHRTGYAYDRAMEYNQQGVIRYVNHKSTAFSVRCLRDPIITDTITFDANNGDGVMPQQIVERGIKVALDSNEFTHTGTYAFIGWNTQRNGYGTAYADADSIVTNGNVTLYAQWHTYCSGNIRSNEAGTTRIDSVRDVDNNWYKVIEIGTQCWLAENMRVTHGQNTGAITQANTNTESATQPYYYDYASSDLTLRERGLLYNWSAAVDSTFDALSSESYTNRQGCCPDGWHLPSDQEWFIMEKNTLIHDGFWDTVTLAENSGILEERDAHITGAGRWVTGDEDAWESDTHPTSPGNFWYSERNMVGLNVIPTGNYKPALHPQHGLTDDGIGANFWTSTTSTQGPGYAVGRDADNFREAVLRHYYEKEFGRSVRCVRDN